MNLINTTELCNRTNIWGVRTVASGSSGWYGDDMAENTKIIHQYVMPT